LLTSSFLIRCMSGGSVIMICYSPMTMYSIRVPGLVSMSTRNGAEFGWKWRNYVWFCCVPPLPNPWLSAHLVWNPTVAPILNEIWPTAAFVTESREAKGGQGGNLWLR
jgi:hypothetical protein